MDPILYWNDVALEANRLNHTSLADKGALGPSLSARALAIVHLAMYDAYVGISKMKPIPTTLKHYLPEATIVKPKPIASVEVAIAAAACATLSKLYPSLKETFSQKLRMAQLPQNGYNEGHAFGLHIAGLIWEDRSKDPNDSDDGYAETFNKGTHRKDPNNAQPINAPFYGAKAKCFSSGQHSLDAPYSLNSAEYLKALKQVRSKGIAPELMGTLPPGASKRKVDETLIGIFWAYDGASKIGTPPRLYNQIIREIAIKRRNELEDNVQLFAMVNVAMGDAGILAWQEKYKHNFWRPVVAIREHDASMGSTGVANNDISDDCDPLWLPLGAPKTNELKNDTTPPFPAYPSGHATFGAAAFHIARLFYKSKGVVVNDTSDDILKYKDKDGMDAEISIVSDEFDGMNSDSNGTIRPRHVRKFPKGLWQMV
jgi:Vanadium chloroperoxidase N-terminal domain